MAIKISNGLKRAFDLFFSIVGLIILIPFFILIAALIKLTSDGPVFFRQKRVGKNGKIFVIYKFRTMQKDAPYVGNKFATPKDDPRITKFGYFLRKLNIDELPQLVNVIKGDMSLVGPRPEVPEVVGLYKDDFQRIISVKPGMTDYASLAFRREAEMLSVAKDAYAHYVEEIVPKKISLNLRYIKEQSLVIDIKLIIKTIIRIVSDIF